MKIAVVCLSLLSVVACSKKRSSTHTVPVEQPAPQTDAPLDPVVDSGTGPSVTPLTSPGEGVYLGTCSVEGTHGFANGIEVTSTSVMPTTALFNSTDCASGTLSSWGHTDYFASFSEYSASVAAQSQLAGDETTITFDTSSINFLSKSGAASNLKKVPVILAADQRFKIFATNLEINTTATPMSISGTLELNKGPLSDAEFVIHFYCEDANKKPLAQEVSFSTGADGVTTFAAKLGTWGNNQVPANTRCQATLATVQTNGEEVSSTDVAWSQFIDIK